MSKQAHPFTSTEEIQNLEPGDSAVVLCGYIDHIDGLKLVKQGTGTLLKFVINNGDGTRIRVLMWDNVAKANVAKLSYFQKIYLTMGSISPANLKYHGSEDVVNVEFNVQDASTIEYLGILEGAGIVTPKEFPEVPMGTLLDNEGSAVTVVGFIKSPFVTVTHSSASYGGGCVVFDKHRLSVQIAHFKEQNQLGVGMCVKLMGKLKSKMSKTMKNTTEHFFEVPDMDHVIVIPGKTATEEEMALAIISATSKRYSTGKVSKEKRLKTFADFPKENNALNGQDNSESDYGKMHT